MSSRMGPNYACLFGGYMQECILSTYTGFIPQLYKQYIDNIVGAASCRRDELEGFITNVSTFRFAVYSHHFSNPDTFSSHSASQVAESARPFTTKTPTLTTIYITPLLTRSTARMAFPIPSSCAFAVFALRMMTSCRNARKCPPFSRAVAIPRIYCRLFGKGFPPSPAKKTSRNVCVETKEGFLWYWHTTPWLRALNTFCLTTSTF